MILYIACLIDDSSPADNIRDHDVPASVPYSLCVLFVLRRANIFQCCCDGDGAFHSILPALRYCRVVTGGVVCHDSDRAGGRVISSGRIPN